MNPSGGGTSYLIAPEFIPVYFNAIKVYCRLHERYTVVDSCQCISK